MARTRQVACRHGRLAKAAPNQLPAHFQVSKVGARHRRRCGICKWQGNAIASSQRHHQVWLQRAFNMNVQLRLGQSSNETQQLMISIHLLILRKAARGGSSGRPQTASGGGGSSGHALLPARGQCRTRMAPACILNAKYECRRAAVGRVTSCQSRPPPPVSRTCQEVTRKACNMALINKRRHCRDGECAAATCAGRPSVHGLAERAQHCYPSGTCCDYTQFIQPGRPSREGCPGSLSSLAVNPRRLRPLHIAGGLPGIAMLSLVARQGALARQLLPAAALAASTHVQERGMKIFEVRESVAATGEAVGGSRLGVGLPPQPPPAACRSPSSSEAVPPATATLLADLQQGGAGEAQGQGAGVCCHAWPMWRTRAQWQSCSLL